MPDNPKKRGGRDRKKVSNQDHELHYMAQELGVSWQQVAGAKRATGSNNRNTLKAYIRKKQGKGLR